MVSVPQSAPAWARQLADDLTRELVRVNAFPVKLPPFAKADLPDPGRWVDCSIIVSDDVGGRVPAFSDGTAWRRYTDRNVIS